MMRAFKLTLAVGALYVALRFYFDFDLYLWLIGAP